MAERLASLVPTQSFIHELPISKQSVSIRRYKHGDLKNILHVFQEFKEKKVGRGKMLFSSVLNLVQTCVTTPSDIDVANLDIADFTHLMCYLKQVSKAETSQFTFRCQHTHEDEEGKQIVCNEPQEIEFHLEEAVILNQTATQQNTVEIIFDEEKKQKIVVHVKPFTFNTMLENASMFEGNLKDKDVLSKFYSSFITALEIYKGEGEPEFRENINPHELIEFIDALDDFQMAPLVKYINTRPKLYWKKEYNCKKCGTENVAELKEVLDFF